jgi:hypothetical protein
VKIFLVKMNLFLVDFLDGLLYKIGSGFPFTLSANLKLLALALQVKTQLDREFNSYFTAVMSKNRKYIFFTSDFFAVFSTGGKKRSSLQG